MTLIDVGAGTPVVLVPGIQGRWEWMKPTVDALQERCRVITFSLADEPTCAGRFDEAAGFSSYVEQIAEALDAAGLRQSAICGVSYGGLVAAAFVARYPERATALALVSAMPPSWKPDARARFFLRAPWLLTPLFCLASLRLYPEIAAAVPGFAHGVRAAISHGLRALRYIFSPGRMARRVRMLDVSGQPAGSRLSAEFERVNLPTLVVTGEPSLDRVVSVNLTREYLRIWPHANEVTIARTGHLGIITRPHDFARILVPFIEGSSQRVEHRRRVV